MVYEKIKERKRLFPEIERERPKKTIDEMGRKHVEMPSGRLVKACPGVKNPGLIFKDGKFVRA